MKKMNKKGVFFTLLVITILSLFLLSYSFFSVIEDRKSVQRRIDTMNSFLFSLEEDIQRQLFISGFRIIFLFEKNILVSGNYITDLDSTFDEAFFNGTIYGSSDNDTSLLMNGAKFSDIKALIQEKGLGINVNVSLGSPQVSISQDDPWNVKITLTTDFFMEDLSGLASWNKTWVVSGFVPVENFDDPLYTVHTSGTVLNRINRTRYVSFSDSVELLDHAQNSYYMNNTEAPSFLDRLQGDLTAQNVNGIESLAVPKLPSIAGVSIVDHEYIIGTAGSTVGGGMPPYFLIDSGHTGLYQF